MTITNRLDGLASGAAIKVPCRVATTAAITLSALQTIDGVTVVTGDRVLVKDQADTTENGIWVADTGDWSRSKDCDGNLDTVDGTIVMVNEGTVSEKALYRLEATDPVIPGTSAIVWAVAITANAILFIPAGTGAPETTVQQQLRNYTGTGFGTYNATNTISGIDALGQTDGSVGYNTAVGWKSQENATIAGNNTSFGARSMRKNIEGNNSVAVGENALQNMGVDSSAPAYNTAVGMGAMYVKADGSNNTAVGADAFGSFKDEADRISGDVTGVYHDWANNVDTGGSNNSAFGQNAITYASGDSNTGIGQGSAVYLTTGDNNTVVGAEAGAAGSPSGLGNYLETGSNNTLIGYKASPTYAARGADHMTAIGADAVVSTGDTVVLGRTTDVTVIGKTGALTNSNYTGANVQLANGVAFDNVPVAGKFVLDWYEEKDFTPTFTNLTVVGALVTSGHATRIGRLVHFTVDVSGTTSSTSPGSTCTLDNLPWPAGRNDSCLVQNASTGTSEGIGLVSAGGTVAALVAWAATAGTRVISGTYEV